MPRYPDLDGTQHCHDAPPALVEAFTGAPGADPTPALALCVGCPFLTPCRAWALEHDVRGVWGATTTDERDRDRPPGAERPAAVSDELDQLVLAWRANDVASHLARLSRSGEQRDSFSHRARRNFAVTAATSSDRKAS